MGQGLSFRRAKKNVEKGGQKKKKEVASRFSKQEKGTLFLKFMRSGGGAIPSVEKRTGAHRGGKAFLICWGANEREKEI